MSSSGEGRACVRCGHTRKVPVGTARRLLRRVRGRPVRATCGEATEHGWPCQCRSRFHAD